MTPIDFLKSPPENIVHYPNPVLSAIAKPIEDLEPWQAVADIMFDLMVKFRGCGLAAPQVGLSYRMFILNVTKPMIIINPELLEVGDRLEKHEEGCLSLPGVKVEVVRPRKIKARWTNTKGKQQIAQYEGLTARAFQHELDHCFGVLINEKNK
jgi:peptide deformylase